MRGQYWLGYLHAAGSGPGSSAADVFRAGPDFRPEPGGGWGSYFNVVGPMGRREARSRVTPAEWRAFLARERK